MDQWLNFVRTAKHKIGGGADNRIKAYDRYWIYANIYEIFFTIFALLDVFMNTIDFSR